MNDENQELNGTAGEANEEAVVGQAEETRPATGNRDKYLLAGIGGLLLFGIIATASWYVFFGRAGGEPVAAPRGVAFGNEEKGSVIPEGEQIVSLTDEQLKAADLKIVTIGETLAAAASDAAATGVVRPNEYKETPIISQVGGVVKSINAELGSYVRKGQTIAVVSSEELARIQSAYLSQLAELDESQKRYKRAMSLSEVSEESRNELDGSVANLKTAEATVSETKANFTRSQKLAKIGAISQRDLEQAEAAFKTADARRDEASKRLDRARDLLKINPARRNEIDSFVTMVKKKESELGALRERLYVLGLSKDRVRSLRTPRDINADLPITSPVSGSVTDRVANRGEVVAMNATLATVTDLSTVWVIAQVYEKDLGKVTVGSGAGVTSDSFEGEYFRGNVSYVDPQLDESTRTAKVRIELQNPGQKFKLGMYVKVALATIGGTERTMPLVPEAAVQYLGDEQILFEATDDPTKFVIRRVKLLQKTGGSFPATKGIFVGDRVVADGSFLLRAEWLKTNSVG